MANPNDKLIAESVITAEQLQLAKSNLENSKVKVFDPRVQFKTEEDQQSAQIVWTSKSVELAEQALKEGVPLRASPFVRGNPSLRKPKLPFQFTAEELEEFLKCEDDIEYFANNFVKLKTPEGITNIKLRPHQMKWLKNLQMNRFNIGMWSRQSNKTTTTAIFFAHYTLFNTDKTIAILAQRGSIGAEVFSKVRGIIANLPFFLKPGCFSFGSEGYSFDNGCRAITRATKPDCLQGYTIDAIYIDEFAYLHRKMERPFWENVYPTISSIPDSKVIITSTPNGKNLFWELWTNAVKGKNKFVPLRVDWWEIPGRDEAWKEQEIANLGEEGFAQQYGLSFDASTRKLLTTATYKYLKAMGRDFVAGRYAMGTQWDSYFRWDKYAKIDFRNDYFVLSVDVGEGLGSDASVIKIRKLLKMSNALDYDIDRISESVKLVTVGVFECSDIQIADFAKVLITTAKKFTQENIRLVIERNSFGDILMSKMETLALKNEWYELDTEIFAKFQRSKESKFENGLRLNSSNKRIGVAAYKDFMNNRVLVDLDNLSIEQVREFGDDGRGNYKAMAGHDDLVMPDINLSYYIKSENFGWNEFMEEFLLNYESTQSDTSYLENYVNYVEPADTSVELVVSKFVTSESAYDEYDKKTLEKNSFGEDIQDEKNLDEYELADKLYTDANNKKLNGNKKARIYEDDEEGDDEYDLTEKYYQELKEQTKPKNIERKSNIVRRKM